MKKLNYTYRITAISLALLMFFTSVGVSMDMHFCQGELKTVSFFGKAKSCHEIGEGMKNCPHHQNRSNNTEDEKTEQVEKKSCCENQLTYVHLVQDQQSNSSHLIASHSFQQFLIAYANTFLAISFIEKEVTAFELYKPPTFSRDIPVLFERFLL